MAGRSLLQTLWVAVIVGTATAQDHHNRRIAFMSDGGGSDTSSVLFPDSHSSPEVPHFLEPKLEHIPPSHVRVSSPVQALPPVRAIERPLCATDAIDASAPCVEDVDYNHNIKDLVNRFIDQSNSINAIIRDPMLSVILNDSSTPFPNRIDLNVRFGGLSEVTVCGAREELIFPQRAKTPKNDWVFVVNQENVRQALRVERCFKDGEPCDFGIASSRDVSTVCRQKYVYRRMLTLGNNAIEPEEVLMPSCCVCYRRSNNFDIGTRIFPSNDTGSEDARTTIPGESHDAARQPEVVPQPHHEGINFSPYASGHAPSSGVMIRSSEVLRRSPHQQPPINHNPVYFLMGGN